MSNFFQAAGSKVSSAAQFANQTKERIAKNPEMLAAVNRSLDAGTQAANVAINHTYMNVGMSNQRVARSGALANPWEWSGPTAPGKVLGAPQIKEWDESQEKNYVPEGSDFMPGVVPDEHHWATRAIPTDIPEEYKAENFMRNGEWVFSYNSENLGDHTFT